MLEIADSGAKMHLLKQANPTMAPLIMANYMKARLPDGSTMKSSYTAALQILGLSKQERQIHNSLKMKTAPLISLGILCDDGCTIKIDKQ